MRQLSKYQKFDFTAFNEGKEYTIASSRYNEKRGCITLSVVITADETRENLYEKFSVHLINERSESALAKYPAGAEIEFTQVGKCSVWGDFNNQLSVEAVVEVLS